MAAPTGSFRLFGFTSGVVSPGGRSFLFGGVPTVDAGVGCGVATTAGEVVFFGVLGFFAWAVSPDDRAKKRTRKTTDLIAFVIRYKSTEIPAYKE